MVDQVIRVLSLVIDKYSSFYFKPTQKFVMYIWMLGSRILLKISLNRLMAVVRDNDPDSNIEVIWAILNEYRNRLIANLNPVDDLKLENIKYDLALGVGLN